MLHLPTCISTVYPPGSYLNTMHLVQGASCWWLAVTIDIHLSRPGHKKVRARTLTPCACKHNPRPHGLRTVQVSGCNLDQCRPWLLRFADNFSAVGLGRSCLTSDRLPSPSRSFTPFADRKTPFIDLVPLDDAPPREAALQFAGVIQS